MAKFIDPANLVNQIGIESGQTVADFGCGSGFYVLPSAKAVGRQGTVYALDIQESKLAATASLAHMMGYHNITFFREDLDKPATNPPTASSDAVIMANILHEAHNRESVVKNAYRVLRTGGRVLVVEWKKEPTPFGPPMEKRVSQRDMDDLFLRLGFKKQGIVESALDSYHYATVYIK